MELLFEAVGNFLVAIIMACAIIGYIFSLMVQVIGELIAYSIKKAYLFFKQHIYVYIKGLIEDCIFFLKVIKQQNK